MLPYRKENIPLAKALRRDMTPAERLLWYRFLRGYPVRFQRQKAIGDFIADFYCAKARLVVELDGSQHGTPVRRKPTWPGPRPWRKWDFWWCGIGTRTCSGTPRA